MKAATLALLAAVVGSAASPLIKLGFENQKPGGPPEGFSCVLTGRGRPGVWLVARDESAPSAPHVLAQTDADGTSYRFPVCVLDAVSAVDADIAVRFRPVSGSVDQAAGLVWRFRDRDNYYLLRANALEGNVVLYKVVDGKRSDIDPRGAGPLAYGRKATVEKGVWGALRVIVRGRVFEAYLNGQKVFEVEDATFTGPGKVGVWTKADSVTYFDDFSVIVLE